MLNRIQRLIARKRDEAKLRKVFDQFKTLAGDGYRLSMDWNDRLLCTGDAEQSFDRHYVYHTAWAARQVAALEPETHVDISSSLYFSSIVSAFVPVDFYDYRQPGLGLSNLTENFADLTHLSFRDESIHSLSCMHVLEHVGLGRYGDVLDPDADLAAAKELVRVLACGGTLLIAVPVGRPRVVFNAHRVYAAEQVQAMFEGLKLKKFALIPDSADQGGLVENASFELANAQEYGCGCFVFGKE